MHVHDSCFRFHDSTLNRAFLAQLKETPVNHQVAEDGVVRYSSADEEAVDDVITAVRNTVFPTWQVVSCPDNWTESYRLYMSRHRVPFVEEMSNGEVWFLIEASRRPHSWKIDEPASERNLRAAM